MFITVQPSSNEEEKDKEKRQPKEKLRIAIEEISEYRPYPMKNGPTKSLITYKDFAGKKPLIVMETADQLDELIATAQKQ